MAKLQFDSSSVVQSHGYVTAVQKESSYRARFVNIVGNSGANQPRDFLANSLEETNECEDLQLQATTNFKADHVDAYDSDCDDKATANAIFMASLSLVGSINDDTVGPPYDSNIFSELDLDEEQLLFLAGGQTNTFDDEVDEGPVQDMAQNEDNIFQADQCDVFDYDVAEAPTANRVAIDYKNPFYLSKARQVQPALYNGREIVKTNHARALVHDLKDTLKIAETTRKQMIAKMKDPECVKKKVKIAPQ
ncbi:hypothetical protein Tco_0033110 [Tanacetum coccineum]